MSLQRIILLLGSVSLIFYLARQEYLALDRGQATLLTYQLAHKPEADQISSKWDKEKIDELKFDIRVDYFFLIVYSCLLAGLSTERMNFEHNPHMNNLFRFSILLSFAAGGVDIVENMLTASNLKHPEMFCYVGGWTIAKFALVTWVILMLVVAWLRRWHKTGNFFPS